jgi:Kef-type K+ transport system membrane component KefB
VADNETIEVIAGIGALILLFEVGLESTVEQMLKVGLHVAARGDARCRVALRARSGAWVLLLQARVPTSTFPRRHAHRDQRRDHGASPQDLGASGTQEARIILGAAVIDDVLGLIILGAVGGAITAAAQGSSFSMLSVARTTAAAAVFLVGALVIGVTTAPRLFSIASLLQVRGVLVTVSLSVCFLMAWASSLIGLAPIVGAFAAGLVLEEVHFKDFVGRGERSLEELIRPISDVFVPIFFVLMGLRTDLRVFLSSGALELAEALIVVAIIGKQACALGVTLPGVKRMAVGIGMIPRGEVGLIFASVGARLTLDGVPIIGPTTFSAVVLMVIVTTLVTPPALKWSLLR